MGQITIGQLKEITTASDNDLLAVWKDSDSNTRKISLQNYTTNILNTIKPEEVTSININEDNSEDLIIKAKKENDEQIIQTLEINTIVKNLQSPISQTVENYMEDSEKISNIRPEFKDTYTKGVLLAQNEDLDDYTTLGKYYNLEGNEIINSPFNNNYPNFKMSVEQMGTNWLRQTIQTDNNNCYIREGITTTPTSSFYYEKVQDQDFNTNNNNYYTFDIYNLNSGNLINNQIYYNCYDFMYVGSSSNTLSIYPSVYWIYFALRQNEGASPLSEYKINPLIYDKSNQQFYKAQIMDMSSYFSYDSFEAGPGLYEYALTNTGTMQFKLVSEQGSDLGVMYKIHATSNSPISYDVQSPDISLNSYAVNYNIISTITGTNSSLINSLAQNGIFGFYFPKTVYNDYYSSKDNFNTTAYLPVYALQEAKSLQYFYQFLKKDPPVNKSDTIDRLFQKKEVLPESVFQWEEWQ